MALSPSAGDGLSAIECRTVVPVCTALAVDTLESLESDSRIPGVGCQLPLMECMLQSAYDLIAIINLASRDRRFDCGRNCSVVLCGNGETHVLIQF